MDPAGTRLKKLRLEKGISLEEIQKKTRIHSNILRAIEGDAITNLSPVYLKSFLKIYCKFLDVDYREYLSDYKVGETIETQKREFVSPPRKQAPQRQPSSSFMQSPAVKTKRLLALNSRSVKSLLVSVAALFLLLGLFRLGKMIFSRHKNKTVLPQQQAKQVPQRKAAVPAPKAQPAQRSAVKPAAQSVSEIRLGIRANDNCWVALKVDGRIVFQRVLAKGRFESWKAKDKMELSLGNAAAVELEVNGQLFSNLGRKGQPIKNILITREGINIPR